MKERERVGGKERTSSALQEQDISNIIKTGLIMGSRSIFGARETTRLFVIFCMSGRGNIAGITSIRRGLLRKSSERPVQRMADSWGDGGEVR